jgi:hypothetical protein
MEHPILSDASQFPTENTVFSHIGKTKAFWISLFDYVESYHPELSREWRYYRDGKSWLLKVTQKKKTIFWLSILDGSFRTTFYFTDKAKAALAASDISEELKEQFNSGKQYGKIKGVTVTCRSQRNVADAKTLIGIKLAMK